MIYGKKRYGECGIPGGRSPAPAPQGHLQMSRPPFPSLGLAAALPGGPTGVKPQIPMKCAFLPAKLASAHFRPSPQERRFPPGVLEVVF